jgi:hypothetical protein
VNRQVVQARGWPFLLFFWSIFDIVLLSGGHTFSAHWLFFQDWLDIFNEKNPRYAVQYVVQQLPDSFELFAFNCN